jgi:hypothetical protein
LSKKKKGKERKRKSQCKDRPMEGVVSKEISDIKKKSSSLDWGNKNNALRAS